MRRAMRVERKTEVRNGIKRGVFALFAIVVELIWVYIGLRNLTGEYSWIPFLIQGLAFVLVLGIYGRHINAAMKMPWILLIAGAPFSACRSICSWVLTVRPSACVGATKS